MFRVPGFVDARKKGGYIHNVIGRQTITFKLDNARVPTEWVLFSQ